MKKYRLSLLIGFILIVASIFILSSCSSTTYSGYISDEERAAHIEKLIGEDGVVMVVEDYAGAKDTSDEAYVNGTYNMYKILENDNYKLYLDFADSSFAVVDKTTGYAYHSDPTNSKEDSTRDDARTAIQSPLALEAYDSLNKRYEFNFYSNCWTEGEFYIVKKGEDTIRFIYTIGNDPDKDLVPPVISDETWDWIQSQLLKLPSKADQDRYRKILNECYKHFTPETLTLEVKEQYLSYYPTLDSMPLYVVHSLTSKQKALVKETMEHAGFTVEMLKAEMEKCEYAGPERAVMYTLPVDVKLTEDGVILNLDSSLILAPSKQKLYKIYFYRAFGAINAKEPDGEYMIIPDGSGSIMPIEGAITTDAITSRIYGTDLTFIAQSDSSVKAQVLSGFGIYERGEKARISATPPGGVSGSYSDPTKGSFVMLLEDGTAQAFISARPYNGTNNTVATLNFDFVYSERDFRTYSGGQGTDQAAVALGDSSGTGVVLAKDETIANFLVHYILKDGGKTYAEHANEFRDYLVANGRLPSKTIENASLQFYLEILGNFDKAVSVAGIPTEQKTPLTSYSDLKTILEKLNNDKVENVNVKYIFWSNGGILNSAFNQVRLLSEMGTQKELSDLVSYMQEKKYGFFPNAEMMYVSRDDVLDGFNFTQDAARRLDMRVAQIGDRSPATGMINSNSKTIISPDVLPKMAASYVESYEKTVGIKSLSIGSIGKDLNSNYKVNRNINRTQAMEYQIETLKVFDGYELMVDTGNDYTWTYAKHIVDMPVGSSEYISTECSIPFIQMLLHGYVYYAPQPLNLSSDYDVKLLECLETGSNLYFRWMAEDDTIFYNTSTSKYFSLNYNDSYSKALAMYTELKPIYDKIAALPITDHCQVEAFLPGGTYRYLQPGEKGYREGTLIIADDTRVFVPNVYVVEYGNQYRIYVNYNSTDVEFEKSFGNNITISAKGYYIEEVKEGK